LPTKAREKVRALVGNYVNRQLINWEGEYSTKIINFNSGIDKLSLHYCIRAGTEVAFSYSTILLMKQIRSGILAYSFAI